MTERKDLYMSSLTRASSSRPETAWEDDNHFPHIQHGQTKMVEISLIWSIRRRISLLW